MKRIVDTLGQIRIGGEVTFENLTLVPMLRDGNGNPDYLLLDQALKQGVVKIKEKGRGGSVPELCLENRGDHPVLVLDGEELVGAKQNRVLNLTILAPSKQTITIPVSCVESGRWAHVSPEFSSSPRAYYADGRASKMRSVSASMSATGERRSDQAAVWADIARKMAAMGAPSPTGAMARLYEVHAAPIEDYVRAFSPLEDQVGALFAIDGQVVGFDAFDHAETLQALFPKLVRSYALDAVDRKFRQRGPARLADAPQFSSSVDAFLRDVTHAEGRNYPAVGLGEDVRFQGPRVTGGALAVKGRVVHLSAFRVEGEEKESSTGHRARMMRRASERGRRIDSRPHP